MFHHRLFSLVRHGDEVCALMLEVIANHDYDKSRFLRGAAIDESRITDIDADEAIREAQPVRYLHPERTAIHLLDKPISFDDTQDAIYRQPAPLIVVSSPACANVGTIAPMARPRSGFDPLPSSARFITPWMMAARRKKLKAM